MYMPDEAHGRRNLALCPKGNDLACVLNPREVSAFSFMTVVSKINLTALYIINIYNM